MLNRVDPEQTPCSAAYGLGLHNYNDNDLFALNRFTMNGNSKPVKNKRNKTKYEHEKVKSNELIIRSNSDNVFWSHGSYLKQAFTSFKKRSNVFNCHFDNSGIFQLFKRQYQLLEALTQLVLIMLIPIPFNFRKKSSWSCLYAVHSTKKWSSFSTHHENMPI